jgi:transcriptional regulator with XRE-family HTH domain
MPLTPEQCRAARGLLNWSQGNLAGVAKVARATLAEFELGKRTPYARTLDFLQSALESAGVEFTNGDEPGVRLKGQGARRHVRRGPERFKRRVKQPSNYGAYSKSDFPEPCPLNQPKRKLPRQQPPTLQKYPST